METPLGQVAKNEIGARLMSGGSGVGEAVPDFQIASTVLDGPFTRVRPSKHVVPL